MMPSPVILKNSAHSGEVLLQECLSTSFGNDLEIVCKDGTIFWSSVLISQWSQLVKYVRNFICTASMYNNVAKKLVKAIKTTVTTHNT